MRLTPAQLDRAQGVLLATAAGDALGAGYEFGPPLPADAPVEMIGGGPFDWAPGEWTDDTSMAIVIAEVAATGADLRDEQAQDRIAARWAHWSRSAADVGAQTAQVLGYVPDGVIAGTAGMARAAAAELHETTGRTAGNGSLMRTAPVALAYLDDPDGLSEAATALSALTHFDPEAGEACVLWCLAIRHAVITGELDARAGLGYLAAGRRGAWGGRLERAEQLSPADFSANGWVVEALQAAWSAISTVLVPPPPGDPRGPFHVLGEPVYAPAKLEYSLRHAVRGGGDADTVAAIAGGLLGGACGAYQVPGEWRSRLHGWPGLRADDLAAIAVAIVGKQ